MNKCNVLVLGNSGVGKSTLINSVLGEDCAKTGFGIKGSTQELQIFENDVIPFRLIDSVGFEPTWFKTKMSVRSIQKWSKHSANKGNEDKRINVIWFCVDGTSSRLFPKTVELFRKSTKIWKSIPIVVVITKSYSETDRNENIKMIKDAFAASKLEQRLNKIIPVVSKEYIINDSAFVPSSGITELIDSTNDLLPDGKKAAEEDIAKYKLTKKRIFAQGITATATAAAIAECAFPIPLADAAMLGPTEIAEVNALAYIYEIEKNEESKNFINSLVEVGTIGVFAKGVIAAVKAIPGLNIPGEILNIVIGGSIVVSLGEGATYIFEQIYLGEKSVKDIDWMKKIMESEYSSKIVKKVEEIVKKIDGIDDKDEIKKIILESFKKENQQ